MTAIVIINLIFTVLSVIVLLKTRFEYRENVSQYDLRYIKWKDGGRYRYNIFVWIGLIFFALIPILPIFLLAGLIGYILTNYYDPETDYDEEKKLFVEIRKSLKWDTLYKILKFRV